MRSRGIAILGSTGSVGRSALRVIARHPERFRVVALTAFGNAELLRAQQRETGAGYAGLAGESADRDDAWGRSAECLVEAATRADVDVVINAVVGAAGLPATLAALRAGKRVALANKESLVVAGALVREAAAQGGGEIVPVDSEHSAILQCTAGLAAGALRRLVITASGGPFRGWSRERLEAATVQDALRHPTWSMGRKITIDSASLANKALEVIEAHHLFGVPYDAIDVVVHPQSIVHSLVELVDGSTLAQLGAPSMELPILYALTYPDRLADEGVPRLDLTAAAQLTFEPVPVDRFPSLRIGIEAGRRGGCAPAVFNAANEAAVARFLAGEFSFMAIPRAAAIALDRFADLPGATLEELLEADARARRLVQELPRS